ncbi:hypothetical protein HWV62_41797 [Athelia sp. TMB]|nr:hypothetical protein HWV62_41797 [Athelia sp. TMB]
MRQREAEKLSDTAWYQKQKKSELSCVGTLTEAPSPSSIPLALTTHHSPGSRYKQNVPISAIVFLHRVSDNRMAGSPLKNLKLFASLCGQAAMPRVILGTTMWSQVQQDTGERREKELVDKYWKDMISEGCAIQRFKDSKASAWGLIGALPQSTDDVLVSREIVDDKKKYNETAAGTRLKQLLDKQVADQQQAIRRMDQQVLTENDPVLVEQIQKRKTQVNGKISNAMGQLQQLRIPFGRKIVALFTGRKARDPGVSGAELHLLADPDANTDSDGNTAIKPRPPARRLVSPKVQSEVRLSGNRDLLRGLSERSHQPSRPGPSHAESEVDRDLLHDLGQTTGIA